MATNFIGILLGFPNIYYINITNNITQDVTDKSIILLQQRYSYKGSKCDEMKDA